MNRAATIALAPLSLIYGAAVATRSSLYTRGILRTIKVNAPVISVGNITTGGTGKSPLVEWIARQLADRNRQVCILTRGYGRKNPQQRVVVSNGKEILSDVARTGDEPMMLAEALRGKAAVVCDSERVAAANWAIDNLKSDAFVLDDGFQHRRIARDLDIVTVDGRDAFGNGWLLPAGRLREPISSLKRADCIVLTRTTADQPDTLQRRLHELSGAPVLKSRTRITKLRDLNAANSIDERSLRDTPLTAFCAIGNPRAFFDQLRREGFDLKHTVSFRDHHAYSQSDIHKLARESIARGAHALVTTAKDAAKLRTLKFDLSCRVVETEIEIAERDQLLRLIEAAITRK